MPRDAEITVLRALATCIARDAGDVHIREVPQGSAHNMRLEVEVGRAAFWRAVQLAETRR